MQLIEFEDMLNEAILLLQSNSSLLKDFQEKYQYILVDEFQDTNKKQIALLEMLTSSMLVNDTFKNTSNLEFEFHYPEIERIIFPFEGEENAPFINWLGEIWTNTQALTFKRTCENVKCIYCGIRIGKI